MSDQNLGTVVGVQTTLLVPSRQHGVLALVRPADGTAGATS